MPQWRKIIVSGSDAELRSVTASNGLLGTASRAITVDKVDVISGGSTTGLGIYSGSFSGSFVGSGTVATIIAGSGLSGGTITSSGTIALDTSSVHFLDGVKKELNTETVISSSAQVRSNISSVDTTGASGINLRYNSSTGVISGSLVNSAVTVTAGSGLSGGGAVSLGQTITVNAVAGAGISLSSPTDDAINVIYGSTSNTAVQGNTNITINGTSNQVAVTGTAAQALGGGPTYTIGLPNDVTIGNNLTVTGDLIVNGTTTTLNTNNILVEDRFILLNSGSVGSSIEGGIIIQSGSTSSGSALIYSTVGSANRWAFVNGLASNATTATPTAYVSQVTDMNVTAHANAVAQYEKAGNIRVETNGDILIYS